VNNESQELIQQIKRELYCDDDFLLDVFQLSKTDMSKKLSTDTLGFKSITNFAEFFKIPIEDLLQNEVNWTTARTSLLRKKGQVDNKYTLGAGTYISTVRNILNYAELRTNRSVQKLLSDKYALDNDALRDDSLMVNIILVNDLIRTFSESWGLNVRDLENISEMGLLTQQKMLAVVNRKKTLPEKCRAMATNSTIYEKNFNYGYSELGDGFHMFTSSSKPEMNNRLSRAELSPTLTNELKGRILEKTIQLQGHDDFKLVSISNNTTTQGQKVDFLLRSKQQLSLQSSSYPV
jgi:hypothetical protein